MVWTFIARLVLALALSALSYALSPRPKRDTPRAAVLRHIAGSQWATRKYMNMDPLYAEQTSTHGAVA